MDVKKPDRKSEELDTNGADDFDVVEDAPNNLDSTSSDSSTVNGGKKIAVSFHEDAEPDDSSTSINTDDSTDEAAKKLDNSEEPDPLDETTAELDLDQEVAVQAEDQEIDESAIEEISATSAEDEEVADTEAVKDSTEQAEAEEIIDPEKSLEELSKESSRDTSGSDVFPLDAEIDAAVDDIVRAESDEVIADADARLAEGAANNVQRSFRQKITGFFKAWWSHKLLRYTTLFLLLASFTVSALLPATRYAVLNALGVRVASSLTVIDSQTRLPLKNIQVALQDKTARTDDKGAVSFSDLKLGNSTLVISKIGYAENTQQVVLGWGSNPLDAQELIATGEQFVFNAQDWLSAAPIANAEAESGESSARADSEGKITLTVGEGGLSEAEVTIRAEGYRDETLKLSDLTEETVVSMVPDRKHAFVSNRNGQYDLYVIDVDGKNEKLLLEATNKERETPVIVPHPSKNSIAFISSRSGEQNRDGYIVDELFIVDTQTGEQNRIARSEQLQIVGWHEDTLVFWQVIEGTSVANPERSKLISYNSQTKTRLELAGANYFNDVRLVNGLIYYAVSSYAVPQSQAKLFTVQVDGPNKIRLIDQLVFGIFRTSYDTLVFAADNQKWFQEIGRGQITETGPQAQPVNKRFIDSPNGERTVWVEVRDGRGVLLMSETKALDQEERVLTLPGLESVAYWLNDSTLVFRIIRSGETAEYVVNVDIREELKIVDVTASSRIYY